jgi:hypothetical protein
MGLTRRTFGDKPPSPRLGFLLASFSRPALDAARKFLPILSGKTTCVFDGDRLVSVLSEFENLNAVSFYIRASLEIGCLTPWKYRSLSVDAMTVNSDGPSLPERDENYAFVRHVQPHDRRFKCWPLRATPRESGPATEDIINPIDTACRELTEAGFRVRSICANGEPRQNHRHASCFKL